MEVQVLRVAGNSLAGILRAIRIYLRSTIY
jgi:hypothetical protein